MLRLVGSNRLWITTLLTGSTKSILDSNQLFFQGFTWVLEAYKVSTAFLSPADE